ncbi:Unknown protein sequence [Pseudomonas syringae pv. spinaceae]|uniref:Uncharacterized protein n=1 Tax=Pseudomonas syringae pv. spinaceae TaxID=264459 RepID=A0A0N8SVX2_PSESX|nr:hypothetical protein [Pseudomonas syringae]KPY64384.1 Unknown protein sequence [Pseudomonas syringae pv. spinaceae]
MERYKFLYELFKKALDDELDRYKKLDEKASRFLSIFSIGIVAYAALINAASPKALMATHAGCMGLCIFITGTYYPSRAGPCLVQDIRCHQAIQANVGL